MVDWGSSPLARGLRRRASCAGSPERIIPARAGFTTTPTTRAGESPDHPRSRGVYGPATQWVAGRPGSSPLARGLLSSSSTRPRFSGIIPARAGFTAPTPRTRSRTWDHPRSRGVYAVSVCWLGGVWGSSPLARGLRPPQVRLVRVARIIPARAGFTMLVLLSNCVPKDHPRSRGVYAVAGQIWDSSLRIIPARAGFTRAHDDASSLPWDHPRSRGVYPEAVQDQRYGRGSSPLARGLLAPRVRAWARVGIIPARAGFTPRLPVRRGQSWDHPRSRGVYNTKTDPYSQAAGSSPLARGLRLPHVEAVVGTRIIPARAGFTGRPGGK